MTITVKVIGHLIYQIGFSEKELDVSQPTRLKDLLQQLNMISDSPRIITRNGKYISPDDLLQDSDRIAIAPLYSGG